MANWLFEWNECYDIKKDDGSVFYVKWTAAANQDTTLFVGGQALHYSWTTSIITLSFIVFSNFY